MRSIKHTLLRVASAIPLALIVLASTPAFAQDGNPPPPNSNAGQTLDTIPVPSIETLMQQIIEKDQMAKNGGSHINGGLDPNYVRTQGEIRQAAEKQRQAIIDFNERITESKSGVRPMGYMAGVSVGYYPEPNDYAHRNYCGPGATRVALSVRIPADQMPSIDTVGTEENIDPNWGVYMTAVGATLNQHLGTSWYEVNGASDVNHFITRVSTDFNANYALVTGLTTSGLPGWGTYNTNHIVTVNGMYMGDAYPTYYVDTASSYAGYSGNYNVSVSSATDFFNNHVYYNNTQAW
jgi:hypothetical protein